MATSVDAFVAAVNRCIVVLSKASSAVASCSHWWSKQCGWEVLQHSPQSIPATFDFKFLGVSQNGFAVGVISRLHVVDVAFFAEAYDTRVLHLGRCLSGDMIVVKRSVHVCVYVC
jgi:hypothetical protein